MQLIDTKGFVFSCISLVSQRIDYEFEVSAMLLTKQAMGGLCTQAMLITTRMAALAVSTNID